jgi:hypothetical protein
MKKIIASLLLLLLVASMMGGCGGSKDASGSDTPEAAQAEQTADAAGNSGGESANAGSVNTEGLGDLLSSAYVDMMKNKEYMMKYKTTMDNGGQSIVLESTMAVSGDKIAAISKGGGMDGTVIMKDGKVYMVDDTNKTVVVMAQTQGDDPGTIDASDITFVGTGKEDGLVYEEYLASGAQLKYYFDGKKLVKMVMDINGQTMVMEILEMSKDVPASMFDIPSGYQVTEM